MRKLIIAFAALLFSTFSFGQAVQDNATIPISVTLNSILRLTVTSGGNIQFVFNTMANYTSGIAPSMATTTKFSVSSSKAFDVFMGAEDASLFGIEDAAHTLDLATITWEATEPTTTSNGTLLAGPQLLTQMTSAAGLNTSDLVVDTGDAGANFEFEIAWGAGYVADGGTTVIDKAPDVYVTNVFLNLAQQ
jgi:hypothetical protein